MTSYEVLKQPGTLAAMFEKFYYGYPCGWCCMKTFEECDGTDRYGGCEFDWEEHFRNAGEYSPERMAKEINHAVGGDCEICPAVHMCINAGERCDDTIINWLIL